MHEQTAIDAPTSPLGSPPPAGRAIATDRTSRTALVVIGALLASIGLVGVPVSLVAALLTANPCGPFGDHCAQYGQTSDAASGFISLAYVSGVAAVAGTGLFTATWRSARHG